MRMRQRAPPTAYGANADKNRWLHRRAEVKRFENILLVVEEPVKDLDVAAARAVALAKTHQARLSVLYVTDHPRLGPFADQLTLDEVEARLAKQATERLDAALQAHRAEWEIGVDVRFGTPFVEVVQDVLRHRRDLVIKASGDGGTHDFLFGGTDQHLLRKCPCPVWILYGASAGDYRNVIAAVDFDPWQEVGEDQGLNQQILSLAASVAFSNFAKLHVVHAWEPITDRMIRVFSSDFSETQVADHRDRERYRQRARLEDLERQLRNRLGTETYGYLAPQFHLREGNPREVIPQMATELEADLVVMGTISRTGILGFLIGNTAEVILNNLACSVLTTKPAAFVSPITLPEDD
jgi:nucleotide-binding universal stress UspA family protein